MALNLSTTIANAQDRIQGQASWVWLGSIDQGQTWQSELLEVPATTTSVLIRPVATWSGVTVPQRQYFGRSQADFTITRIGSPTTNDDVTAIIGVERFIPPDVVLDRVFGNVIKIDQPTDALPPGQGPLWVHVGQSPPGTIDVFSYSNPYVMMQYTLVLDGSLCDRVVDAVFRPVSFLGVPFDRHIVIYDERIGQQSYEVYPVIAEYQPLTIRVVPGPSVAGILAMSGAGTAIRRRRERWLHSRT